MLTIAEAVEMLSREGFNVSTHKLRQYEKQGLINPVKSLGQHRLYQDDDLDGIRSVLALIDLGFSIKEIKSFYEVSEQAFALMGQITEREEKFQTNSYFSVHNRPAVEASKERMEAMIYKWSDIETNRNLLVFSRCIDFYNRIIETIERKKKMLGLISVGYFRKTDFEMMEHYFEIMQKRIATASVKK